MKPARPYSVEKVDVWPFGPANYTVHFRLGTTAWTSTGTSLFQALLGGARTARWVAMAHVKEALVGPAWDTEVWTR